MKINVSKKDVIWNYIGTFMSLASNVIIIPFLVYFLSSDMLGLWYIFASIGAIATLFDFGFGVTFARNITYCWSGASHLKKEDAEFATHSETDFYLMKKVLETCRRIYLIIAGAALIMMMTVGFAYILYVGRNVPDKKFIIAWIIYAVAVFLNLYYGYFSSFLRGVGDVAEINVNTVIARIVQLAATIFLLFSGAGLIGACIAYLLYGTTFRILGKEKFFRYKGIGEKLAEIKTEPTSEEMNEMFLTVWHNAWREGIVTICNYLSNEASTLICSLFFTLSQTGIYSLGVQIAQAIATVAAALYSAYQPSLQASYVTKDKERVKNIMSLIVVTFTLFFIIGLVAAIYIGLPILRIIKPENVVSVPVLLGLSAYQFILKFRNCYTSYFSCTNRIIYMKAFVVASILCVALQVLFVGLLKNGICGMIIAQIISQAIYNMWIWAYKAHKEMELPINEMIPRSIRAISTMVRKRSV